MYQCKTCKFNLKVLLEDCECASTLGNLKEHPNLDNNGDCIGYQEKEITMCKKTCVNCLNWSYCDVEKTYCCDLSGTPTRRDETCEHHIPDEPYEDMEEIKKQVDEEFERMEAEIEKERKELGCEQCEEISDKDKNCEECKANYLKWKKEGK